MPLDRSWIEAHIPHRGRMCLLAQVLDWDGERIRCLCTEHRATDHPLRAHGRLGIAAGIELGAQAMALHGALSAGRSEAPRAGMLASLRAVRFAALRLDDVEEDLICAAQRLAADRATALYEFTIGTADRCLLSGRATVVLDAGALGGLR